MPRQITHQTPSHSRDYTFNPQDVAVLLPCYNEGDVIASVVLEFRAQLPGSRIFVYDPDLRRKICQNEETL